MATSLSKKINSQHILILLGILAIIPFLFLNLYNHPSMDDYVFASRDISKGFFEAQLDLYMNWSGRYFGTASSRLNPLIDQNFTNYKLYSLIVIVLYLASIYFFIWSLLKPSFSTKSIIALTLTIVTVLLVTMPDIAQGLFWFSGYITYLGAMIYTLCALGLLVLISRQPKSRFTLLYKILAFVLVFAIVGSNELSLVIINATLLLIVTSGWLKYKKLSLFYTSLFLFALFLGLAVVLAPGNYTRMDGQSNSGNLLFSMAGAIAMTLVSFLKWGLIMLTLSIVYVLLWADRIYNSTQLRRFFDLPLWLTITWYLSTMLVMHFLFMYATGFRATTRVENVIHFFFVFGWLYLLQVIINKYGESMIGRLSAVPKMLATIASLMLFLQSFNLDSNITTAYLDLISGRAATFDRELNARYSYLTNSDCSKCPIKPVSVLPKSLFLFSDLKPEELAEMGINNDFERYWEKETIHLTGPTPVIPDNLTILKELGRSIKGEL